MNKGGCMRCSKKKRFKLYALNFASKFLNKISTSKIGVLFSRLYRYFLKLKEKEIFSVIDFYAKESYFDKYKESLEQNDDSHAEIVWVLWMQGLDDAPDIVKECINSIKNKTPNKKLILLDSENIKDYVSFPEFIWEKYKDGVITNTHLSDIVRVYLLCEYGGFWMDATIYLHKEVILNNYEFYTLKDYNPNSFSVSNGLWAGYFMFSKKGGVIVTQLLSLFYNYWENENELIDYFFIDYSIKYFYMNNLKVRSQIDRLPSDGVERFLLSGIINNVINDYDNSLLFQSKGIYKLSHKVGYCSQKNGRLTYYGALLNHSNVFN